jgi:PAS domain S-box-containing protein
LDSERRRLVAAQAVAKVGSWEIDLETRAVTWSDETYHVFETDPALSPLTHEGFIEALHPDDRAAVERNFSASIDECRAGVDEYRIVVGDGRLKVVEERWGIFCDEAGKPLRAVGTVQDVTERNEAHVALQKEREFLAALVENVSDGIVSCDADGFITLFNGTTREFHGLPAEAIPAERWAEHFDLYLPDGKTLMQKEQIPLFRALQEGFVRDAEMVIAPRNGDCAADPGQRAGVYG